MTVSHALRDGDRHCGSSAVLMSVSVVADVTVVSVVLDVGQVSDHTRLQSTPVDTHVCRVEPLVGLGVVALDLCDRETTYNRRDIFELCGPSGASQALLYDRLGCRSWGGDWGLVSRTPPVYDFVF